MSLSPVPSDGSEAEPTLVRGPAPAPAEPPTLVTAAVGDRCANCQVALATDQLYCLNCGERRGKARFSVATLATPAATAAPPAAPPPRRARPRVSSSATLVTGIGTLLLAMGVGVLIGEQGKSGNTTQRPPNIIVNGGGAPAAATPAATTASTPTQSSTHTKGAAKVTKVVVTKKVAAKAAAAAKNVLGGGNVAPPTQQLGGGCSNSTAGCQNGQFTGNFFGN